MDGAVPIYYSTPLRILGREKEKFMHQERLLTPEEALESLGHLVSKGTFYKALNSGQVPSIRLGRRFFISSAIITKMLGKNG